MTCDICKKTGTELEPLLEIYQTEDIKSLCPKCSKITNDHLWKVRRMANKMTSSLLKRFMQTLKGA